MLGAATLLRMRFSKLMIIYFLRILFTNKLDMSRATKPVPNAKPVTPAVKTPALTWKEKLMPEEFEQLRNVFELFDEDHSGSIDPEEINKIMEELGESRAGTFTFALIEGLKNKGKPINFD
jgi:hypothetical protein